MNDIKLEETLSYVQNRLDTITEHFRVPPPKEDEEDQFLECIALDQLTSEAIYHELVDVMIHIEQELRYNEGE